MTQHPLPSDFHAQGSVRAKLMRVILLTTALALAVSGIAMLMHELYVYRTAWAVDISSEGVPYLIFTYGALVPWTFFSNGFSEASNSLINNANLISKVSFPRLIVPTATVVVAFVDS